MLAIRMMGAERLQGYHFMDVFTVGISIPQTIVEDRVSRNCLARIRLTIFVIIDYTDRWID